MFADAFDTPAAVSDKSRASLSGHSRDSSHHRMPCRICSDFDKPVRAVIDDSRSRISGSIMNVQRFFLFTTLTHFLEQGGRPHEERRPERSLPTLPTGRYAPRSLRETRAGVRTPMAGRCYCSTSPVLMR